MMTIDELKKDRHWLAGYTGTERVVALIDAEIERQSVTDEGIQRAISLMEWCKVDVWKNHPIASEEEIANAVSRYDLAIDALRAYCKPEPCEDKERKPK